MTDKTPTLGQSLITALKECVDAVQINPCGYTNSIEPSTQVNCTDSYQNSNQRDEKSAEPMWDKMKIEAWQEKSAAQSEIIELLKQKLDDVMNKHEHLEQVHAELKAQLEKLTVERDKYKAIYEEIQLIRSLK